MADNGTITYVAKFPACNFHEDCKAAYDFRTVQGPWAFGCKAAYDQFKMHEVLGLGKGQELKLDSEKPATNKSA